MTENSKPETGNTLAGRTIKEFEAETLKENIKKAKEQQKELKQKLEEYSQKYKQRTITYTEYEYLVNNYLKGKSYAYWSNYYETYILEAKEQIRKASKLEEIAEEPRAQTKSKTLNIPFTLITILFILGFFFITNYTGLFTYQPATIEFDANKSWNLSATFLRISLGEYTEDMPAENLLNGSKILLYIPGLELNSSGRLYVDLIVDNQLADSKHADITEDFLNEPVSNETATYNLTEPALNETAVSNETITEETNKTIVLKETKIKRYKTQSEFTATLKDRAGRETGTIKTETAGEKITLRANTGKTSIIIRGVRTTTNLEIKTGEKSGKAIIAVKKENQAEDLEIDNATITLPKTGKIKAIGYCPDPHFDFATLTCSNWEATGIPFADKGDTIEFTVKHFSAYSGLSAVTIDGVNLSKYAIASNMPLNYSGLVGWWKLEKGNSSFWNDSSGNGNFMAYNSSTSTKPTYTTEGATGGAYYFDGIDDFIANSTAINTSGEITISMWLKINGDQIKNITVDYLYTCALMQNGDTYCWGDNTYGQIGDGTTTQRNTPTKNQMTAATQITAGGYHTCATNSTGMYCWGRNTYGQIGNGSAANTNEFPTKNQMTAATQITAGYYYTCATNSTGMYCWGYNNIGQIGNGSAANTNEFPTKNQMTAATQITAGQQHTCATNTTGMYCWGNGGYGQIGNGSTGSTNEFPTKNYMTAATQITAGQQHTCATNTTGMYCWGQNTDGRVGDGSVTQRTSPTKNQMTAATQITAGYLHTCATNSTGMYCWGDNYYGQIGNGSNTTTATSHPTKNYMTSATQITAGYYMACATNSTGMYCWGYNGNGQIGNGSSTGLSTSPELSHKTSQIINAIKTTPDWLESILTNLSTTNTTLKAEIQESNWQLITITKNSTTLKLYKNGRQAIQIDNNTSPNTLLTTIGKNEGYYNGTIDEAMIWNKSLSAPEVLNLYNRTKNIYTEQDLGASIVGSSEQASNTSISYSYDWRLNNVSIALLNMPFDLNGSAGTGGNWTTVGDYSSFANHASYNGSVSTMPRWNRTGGYDGFGAYEFDGIDDGLKLQDTINITESITIGGWFNNKKSGTLQRVVNLAYTGTTLSTYVSSSNVPSCTIENSSDVEITINSSKSVSLNTWHNIVCSTNGSNLFLYYDGSLENNTYIGNFNRTANIRVGIGAGSPIFVAQVFNGTIDQVQIFNRTLSAEQIREMYTDGQGGYNRLVSQETAENDNWTVAVTPFDGNTDGDFYLSNIAEILQKLTLNWTATYNTSGKEVNTTTWAAGGQNITFNATVFDPDNLASTVWAVIWKTIREAGAILWEGIMNLINGVYQITAPTNTSFGHNVNYTIYANDTNQVETSVNGTFFYNYAPNLTATLNQTTNSNSTLNLTAIANATDQDGDATSVIYDWRIGSTSIALLNLPFNLNGTGGSLGNWTTTTDYTTNHNNAEYSGSASTMPRWNKTGGYDSKGAYEFDGTDDWLNLSNAPTTSGNMTITLWLKINRDEIKNVTAGRGYHTCALMQNGDTYCWGYNSNGQLGDGTTTTRYIPTKTPMTAAVRIAIGMEHTCATNQTGMYCWGSNSNGQIGDGTITQRTLPTKNFMNTTSTSLISSGGYHTCATNQTGMYCWGNNQYGQIGNGSFATTNPFPTKNFMNTTSASQISSGGYYTCATNSTGMYCWGSNQYGQIGNGTTTPNPYRAEFPTKNYMNTTSASQISAGWYHTCATNSTGMYCWGYNSNGQIGNGTITLSPYIANFPTPNYMNTTTNSQITAGYTYTCATNASGMYCWGSNSNGQIGNGSTATTASPFPTINYMNTTPNGQITAGVYHICATNSTGMYCWGSNQYGQIGNGSAATAYTPARTIFEIITLARNTMTISPDWITETLNSTTTSTTALRENLLGDTNWHLLTITKDNSTIKTYKDGTEIYSTSNSSHQATTLTAIGKSTGYFNGTIDQLTFYNRTLRPEQIAAIYNAGNGNYSTIVWQELTQGNGNWTAALTPTDSYEQGATVITNGIYINTPNINWTAAYNTSGIQINTTTWAAGGANITFNATLTDTTTISTVWITIWKTLRAAGQILWEGILTLINGVYQLVAPTNTSFPHNLSYTIYANTSLGLITAANGTLFYNYAPNITTATLNQTTTSNTTLNLTAIANATDQDGDPTSITYDWRIGGISIALLNLPFNLNGTGGSLGNWTTTTDYTTNNNHATYNGSANTTPYWSRTGGYDGFGAYEFDGTDDWLNLSNAPTTSGNMTISMWLKINYKEIKNITAGEYHTCALMQNGDTYCWGRNNYGQIGDGTTTNRYIPTKTLMTNGTNIKVGAYHTCATNNTGMYCWGNNDYGQIGDGTSGSNVLSPTKNYMNTTTNSQITAGIYHTCATNQTGMYCWGENYYGQIGNGTEDPTDSPHEFPTLNYMNTTPNGQITAGQYHTCATNQTGMYCWGYNDYGQIGDGTSGSNVLSPTKNYMNTTTNSQITAGYAHTCATNNSGMYCWGENYYGQIGNGTEDSNDYPNPFPTPNYMNTTPNGQITAGQYHTCATNQTGMYCWGYNYYGQIGDGTSGSNVLYPTLNRMNTTNTTLISAGVYHTCATNSTGMYCWGDNTYRQIGDGSSGTTVINPSLSIRIAQILDAIKTTPNWLEAIITNLTTTNTTLKAELHESSWQHIMITKDSTTLKLYKNGTQILQIANTTSPATTFNTIGKNTNHYNGLIDQLTFYNRTLTPQQIATIYNAGAGNYSTILWQELKTGENWTAALTPTDSYEQGATVTTNGIYINTPNLNWTSAYNTSGIQINTTTWAAGGANITFNATLTDQNAISTVWVIIWKTVRAAGQILWEGIMALVNGVYQLVAPTNTSFAHNVNYTIYANTTTGLITTANGTFFYNYKPSVTSINLSSTGTNITLDNLTASAGGYDNDSDPFNYTYDWRINSISLALVNMPFNLNGTGGSLGNWTTTIDYSTYKNNAEYNGSTQAMPRWNRTGGYDSKGAYEFDGIDDSLNFNSVNSSITNMTLSLWLKINKDEVKNISAGQTCTCAIMYSGEVYCWGDNSQGQLGDGTTTQRNIPTKTPMTAATQITIGAYHACATNASGMYCWGRNANGQIGDGSVTQRNTPTKNYMNTTPNGQITAGYSHTCATNQTGMYCWGNNGNGQLGDGSVTQRNTPTKNYMNTTPNGQITAGYYHTCATNASGMYCWGYNYYGQIGNGTGDIAINEFPTKNYMNTTPNGQITAGLHHTCATNQTGMYCWGRNNYGQIGNGSIAATNPFPTKNYMNTTPNGQITAGDYHTCATNQTGMYCWGDNRYGQIGNGSTGATNFNPIPTTWEILTLAKNAFTISPDWAKELLTNITANRTGGTALTTLQNLYGNNSWHLLTITKNANSLKTYRNGALIYDIPNTTAAATTLTAIGRTNINSYYNGTIDNFQFYNKTIGPDQIMLLYNQGAGNYSSIIRNETRKNEAWTVQVTATDGYENSIPRTSAALTILNSAPSAPASSTPINNTNTSDSTPTLTWNNSYDYDEDAIIHILQVSNRTDFAVINYTNISVSQTTGATNDTISNALADGTYFWRIRANDGEENSSWSTTYRINIDTTGANITLVNLTNSSGAIINTTQTAGRGQNLTFAVNATDGTGAETVLLTIWQTIESTGIKIWEGFLSLINGLWQTSAAYLNTTFSLNSIINYTINVTDFAGNIANYRGNFSLSNTPPIHTTPLLNASSHDNRTTDNLTAYNQSTDDYDHDIIYNNYDWRLNNISIASLNMNFDLNGSGNWTTVKDYSTNENYGYYSGSANTMPRWNRTGGYDGKGAYQFDGVDDRIVVPDHTSLNNLTQITVEAWVNPGTQTIIEIQLLGTIVKKYYGGDTYGGFGIGILYGGYPAFVIFNGSTYESVTSPNTVTLGNWYHIIGTYNGTLMTIYINGTEENSTYYSAGNLNSSTKDLEIGGTGDLSPGKFNGTIDQVKVYNRTLTPQQIAAQYNGGTGRYDHIVYQETILGEVWTAAVTPHDTQADGQTLTSNSITVANDPPNRPTLLVPAHGNITTNRTVSFNWSATEPDGEAMTFRLTINCYATAGGSCPGAGDNRAYTGITDLNYTLPTGLIYLRDDGYYYNWTITATDPWGTTSTSNQSNVSIAAYVAISLPTSNVTVGTLSINSKYNTTNATGAGPLQVQNDGNVLSNINISATQLFASGGFPSSHFKYKAANRTETGSFNWTGSLTNWTNVGAQNTSVIHKLNWSAARDLAEVDIHVQVPSDEPAGNKSSMLTFSAWYPGL